MPSPISPAMTAGLALAALTFDLAPTTTGTATADRAPVPTDIQLLPVGPFRSTDTRPEDVAAWQLDAQIAERVIERAATRGTDILIDFEHQSLHAAKNGKRVEAAGWIPRTLIWREGQGLFATGVVWAGDSAELIATRKVRYVSTVFLYDGTTGEVLYVVSVTLTNTPAVDTMQPLADLTRRLADPRLAGAALSSLGSPFFSPTSTPTKESDMSAAELAALTTQCNTLNTQVAALTAERDGYKTQVAALTTERDTAKSDLQALKDAQAEALKTAEKAKCTEQIQAALTAGSLLPAQKAFAEKLNLADLTEFLGGLAPVVALTTRQADNKDAGGTHGLSAAELAACTQMGVTPEEFKAARSSQ